MRKAILKAGLVALVPLALASCGGSGDSTQTTTTATYQSKFGSSFQSYFDTSPTTTDANVKHPTSADVPPLSLTTEPIDN